MAAWIFLDPPSLLWHKFGIPPLLQFGLFWVFISLMPFAVFCSNDFSFELAKRRKYRLALIVNRFSSFTPVHVPSARGWLLLEAGLYDKAKAYIQRFAFDKSGQPVLGSWELLCFAFILLVEKDYEAVERLCEASIPTEDPPGRFHIRLADCLLDQKKTPERARELIGATLSAEEPNGSRLTRGFDSAEKIGMHAYALAACGRTGEAEMRLEESLSEFGSFDRRERAALCHIAAETWCSLGNLPNARAALLEALRLHPSGDIGFRVRRKLAEIGAA